ncbi:hypothetical protein [Yonghaparkia sp. Soil809]|uniref:hypothetical protein n=1 Tax=Yonghaparkia sp. Soil809 TaxID=1736417 RepID=UPI0006FF32C6|nr:hypothetical protein [Yonghaparkia sp. Soil809]KRF31219.1 hypothetical protein ASG83_10475 [Yonghaparkia sp. Soil809]
MPRALSSSDPHEHRSASLPAPPSSGLPAAPGDPAAVGGYRLVRRLDEDEAVVTWLARGGEETVVLRVFRDSAPDARIDAELGARERLHDGHVPELLDVATSRNGRPVPVIAAVVGPLLSDVLPRATSPLRAGHVTTILAPIAALLDGAHELGVTLGRLDAAGIRLDSSGAPIVVALGAAGVAAPLPERFRDREPAIRADRAALRAFGDALADRVHERERDAVRAALASAGEPRALELALFDCAAPLPLQSLLQEPDGDDSRAAELRRSAPTPAPRGQVPAELPTSRRQTLPVVPSDPPEVASGVDRVSQAIGLPAGLLRPVGAALRSAQGAVGSRVRASRALVTRVAGGPRPRRGVVLVGAAGLVALLAAGALASAESTSASSAPGTPAPPSDPAAQGRQATPRPAASTAAAEQRSAAALPESLDDPTPEEWSPLVGELVDRWIACAPSPSEDCAASVAHAGSSAHEALMAGAEATASVEALSALQEWAGGERTLIVVDRMGAAALVDLLEAETATASLLVVRSEAGWRVRAVMP